MMNPFESVRPLPGDKEALAFERRGPRASGGETIGYDHLMGTKIQGCRNQKEARQGLLSRRQGLLERARDESPIWASVIEDRLAGHQVALAVRECIE